MNLLTAALLGAFAASSVPRGALFSAGGKEAEGFDEELPEEKPEPVKVEEKEPEPERTAELEPEGTVEIEPEWAEPRHGRGLNVSVAAGGFFPVKGSRTDYDPTFAMGAAAWKKLNPRMGIALSLDFARLQSYRSVVDHLILHALVRLRLTGEDISTCPLYAGFGAGFVAEDVTDDYDGRLPGNLGPSLSMRLGVRLGEKLELGLGYMLHLGSENSPGAGLASVGYSF